MTTAPTRTIDPIDLEVLRTRLESVGQQACRTVENTAVSPAVTESKDYSVTLMDAHGSLIIGSGQVVFHFGAAAHAVRATLARHHSDIAPGDVFLANDPHSGGGLHPQDVMIQQPIHVGETLVAWVGVSAHLMDMGGMVVGSFAPDATECYQEAFRIPPVRLFRRGEENTDVWDLLRTNVRLSELVEMDLRGLVAGAHFTTERISEVVESAGVDVFIDSLEAIRSLSEREMRKRIELLEDGVYSSASWTEYDQDFYEIPCTLTVAGDTLRFDFEGAAPQCPHFFNSKPYIIASELIVMIAQRIAADLPFNEGMFAPIELCCPEGTIVNCTPPAPISAAHMHVGLNAAGVGMHCLTLALGASPNAAKHRYLAGAGIESALANQIWSWTTDTGEADAFISLDGNWAGGSAGAERDGGDLGRNPVGARSGGSYPDIEVLESWYPLLFTERRTRPGSGGAGTFRSGGGNLFGFTPHGVDQIDGVMFGMRRYFPVIGHGGGEPGACTELLITRADGTVEEIAIAGSDNVVRIGDTIQMRLASGGGYGDPLDRDAAAVIADVSSGRITSEDAHNIYGVTSDGGVGTKDLRTQLRAQRLNAARPARLPVSSAQIAASTSGPEQPLYPGVVQRGQVAYASESGAPLAITPSPWTDGCAVLTERLWGSEGPPVLLRTYLDPKTGTALHVEPYIEGSSKGMRVLPVRWTSACR